MTKFNSNSGKSRARNDIRPTVCKQSSFYCRENRPHTAARRPVVFSLGSHVGCAFSPRYFSQKRTVANRSLTILIILPPYFEMVAWISITVPVIAVAIAIQANKDRVNRILMGFFRDVGRVKAYRRRTQDNSMALMTVLMKQEDPLLGVNFDEEPDDVPTYTADELLEYGQDEDKLLLSVFGRIYDVTAGQKFYGPTARYNMFPGRDVTYALGTGCKAEECLEKSAQELTLNEVDEAKRWLSFFQLHDKYAYVGKLENNPMEAMMEQWVEEAVARQKETGTGGEMPKIF